MVTPSEWLKVDVTFPLLKPPSFGYISISFPEPAQAQWYHNYIIRRPFHSDNQLRSRLRDKTVRFRLHFCFTGISTNLADNNFHFAVSDKRFAEDWVASMLVWRLLPGDAINPNQARVVVIRNWRDDPYLSSCFVDRPPLDKAACSPLVSPPRWTTAAAAYKADVEDTRAIRAPAKEPGRVIGSAEPRLSPARTRAWRPVPAPPVPAPPAPAESAEPAQASVPAQAPAPGPRFSFLPQSARFVSSRRPPPSRLPLPSRPRDISEAVKGLRVHPETDSTWPS